MEIKLGYTVTFEARGARGDNGDTREIPAIVIGIHPDGSLQLFAFHFEGSHLVHSIRREDVTVVTAPQPQPADKFSFAK